MSFVIRRNDAGGSPTYFSPSTGRKLGSPLGGWVQEPDKAIQFAREQDGEEFIDSFMSTQRANLHVVRV